tara:strand:+ start:463 stop:1119 length:657 start_codon:yes stop_codon:yes gene_type:complete
MTCHDRLQPIAEAQGVSTAQVAMAYCLPQGLDGCFSTTCYEHLCETLAASAEEDHCVARLQDDITAHARVLGRAEEPHALPVVVPSGEVFDPILDALGDAEGAEYSMKFARGALFANGRLDLCKQVVQPRFVDLCEAVAHNPRVRHFLIGNNLAVTLLSLGFRTHRFVQYRALRQWRNYACERDRRSDHNQARLLVHQCDNRKLVRCTRCIARHVAAT